ncbi:hypothetical protein ACB098_11G049300 [Castanea mollissima]
MRGMRQPMQVYFVLYFLCCIFSIFVITTAVDTIVVTQSVRDGQTLVSSGGNFELGFFRSNSKSWYIGIWYKKISTMTVVWVANRDTPLNNTAGAFKLVDQGILVLMDEANNTIWSSNSSRAASNPVAQLLDTGNFIVRDGNSDAENIIWQSFDHPADTFLPGMKFGFNLVTGLSLVLTSWKSPDDPSGGNYTIQLDPNGLPQFILREGPTVLFRTGPWNGLHFSGMPNVQQPNPIYKYEYVSNPVETYYTFQLINDSVVSRMVLTPDGKFQRLIWIDRSQSWSLYFTAQEDGCDRYALCGAYGSCNINNAPVCECLTGFVPKFPKDWNGEDWSHGCVPKTPLNCGAGEGFLKYPGIKLPDTRQSWYNRTMDHDECRDVCLKNCTCTAYSTLDITGGGSGCILWFGELIDIRVYTEYGQDIFIRMAASELPAYGSSKRKKQTRIIVIALLSFGMALLSLCLMLYVSKKKPKREGIILYNPGPIQDFTGSENDDLELPLFRFATIAYATDNFSVKNVLGKGGFGQVYKGILTEGQENKEIAVKRLSANSRQGLHEFKNEVLSISKLQHHPNRSILIDWPKRFHIINGIARGLLYLHQDSRLRIIHRDLKASNILLDYEMNPKIADFGIARIFGGDETEAKTSRVVGTYGYMPPEYAIDGLFSVKSDVYSFGVLVLEIVSGKRNRGFCHPDHNLNLLGHAWRLYKKARQLELIDKFENESCNPNEVLRSIHVGLLCVQQCPEYRPTMSTVVLMLSSEIALPEPKEPGFHTGRYLSEMDSSPVKQEGSSTNGLTITLLEAQ